MTEDERRERNRQACRRHYLKHREQRLAYQAQWRADNRDRVNAVRRAWREKNRDELNAKRRATRPAKPKPRTSRPAPVKALATCACGAPMSPSFGLCAGCAARAWQQRSVQEVHP